MVAKTKDEIKKIFNTPGHPVAFSNPRLVYNYINSLNDGTHTPLRIVQEALSSTDSYSLHVEKRKPRHTNPFFVYNRRSQGQMDLFDMSKVTAENDNVTFILLFIDVFSRKVYLRPMRNKKGPTVRDALQDIFDNSIAKEHGGKLHSTIVSDLGTEFHNKHMKSLLASKKIKLIPAYGVNKAAIGERVIKSLRVMISKYMSEKETNRYLDVLPTILDSYNARPHTTLQGLSPNEADDPTNEIKVRAIHNARYARIRKKRKKPKFSQGDIVRVKTLASRPSSSARAFAEQAQTEMFVIHAVHTRMPIVTYSLQSADNDEIIRGTFYEYELVAIEGSTFKVEKVLKTRGRGKKKQLFVKWFNFSDKHNSWISSQDVVDTY